VTRRQPETHGTAPIRVQESGVREVRGGGRVPGRPSSIAHSPPQRWPAGWMRAAAGSPGANDGRASAAGQGRAPDRGLGFGSYPRWLGA
jgi:hypothetical protein